MARIGVSKLYVAKATETASAISYSDCKNLAKVTKVDISIDSASSNDFYADNGIAESDKSFSGGTFKVTPDDLTPEDEAFILGLTTQEITVGEDTVTEVVHDEDADAPNLGAGIIIKKKKGGVYSYRAVIFTKVKFGEASESTDTQGETISWQTTDYESTIMRDVTSAWKREATFDTEAKAEAYIKQVLNYSAS